MKSDTQKPHCTDDTFRSTAGRFAAGEDPAKREQIIDGAKRAFMKFGFDAASMNDITREAGVSKGTIYVYFQNKEDLFSALIEREKGLFASSLRDIMAGRTDTAAALHDYGVAFVHQIVDTDFILALRTVLGVVDRMPGLCQSFFASSPANARTVLIEFLARQCALGLLVIDDLEIASRQFIELSTGAYFKLKLFGEMATRPPEEEIIACVDSGIAVFLAAYGAKAGRP
ncbi:TetR/AcrR family transcriptional regulator [Allorhizobium undicola]|uniref:TetR/AcrR family transcriptional regulator n=1 Tax=Allorhizobium undicola TaxID=78527 RepID=UPI000486957B|nr:TetR/AcrR family transcriptional regulator [Allorhizobium undicola]